MMACKLLTYIQLDIVVVVVHLAASILIIIIIILVGRNVEKKNLIFFFQKNFLILYIFNWVKECKESLEIFRNYEN
jgi:hypothetical protein